MTEQKYLDFGNRLWGSSITIMFFAMGWKEYPLWACILNVIVLMYFFWFGNSRFTKGYRRIL